MNEKKHVMAPIDFEKNIAEKLKQREIMPTEEAWDKIASRLESQPSGKRSGFSRPWMYAVAAGLLLFIGLYQGLKVDPTVPDTLDPVPVAVKPNEEIPSFELEERQHTILTDEAGLESSETGGASGEGVAGIPEETPTEPTSLNPLPLEDALPETREETVLAAAPEISQEEGLDRIISEQLDAVVAQVDAMESEGVLVTDAEIDSLLQQAQEAIAQKPRLTSEGRVDAMALLDQAEFELDRSFREDIFEKLKSGFNKVRLAMAHKND